MTTQNWNQLAPGGALAKDKVVANYWSYVGTTTACVVGKAAVMDDISGGAYKINGTTRATLGVTPTNGTAYTLDSGWADPQANFCYPNTTSIAAQRQSVVGVLARVVKGDNQAQCVLGDRGEFIINGRCLVTVNGFNDDATTGAAAKIGTFLTLDGGATTRMGGFRVAASGEIIKAKIIATSAGVATGTADVVASSFTGTAIVQLMGDSLAKL